MSFSCLLHCALSEPELRALPWAVLLVGLLHDRAEFRAFRCGESSSIHIVSTGVRVGHICRNGRGGSRVVAWGTAVPPIFFEKHLICILFNNIYMYNTLLYIIASLLSLYNNLNTLYSQLFYHCLVI